MRQDRVIRILDKFCKLFLDRKQTENSADEESAEPATDFSTVHNVILSCKFNSAREQNDEIDTLVDVALTSSSASMAGQEPKEIQHYLEGFMVALCGNFDSSLFSQHLGRLHGIPASSICSDRQRQVTSLECCMGKYTSY